MLETYRGGYKKALLDVKRFLEIAELRQDARSSKRYANMLNNLIDLLLQNPRALDEFMNGTLGFKINTKTQEVFLCEDKSN